MKPISRRMKQVNREKDAKPVDMSQLRQPIRLGGSALDQVLNAVHYGSPEMRSLLQVECSFIFECKVCRGLFRDLPNFISHKRVFCDKSVLDEQWINLAQIPEEEVFVVESAAAEETRPGSFKEPSRAPSNAGDLPAGTSSRQVQVDRPFASSSKGAEPDPDLSESLLRTRTGSNSGSVTEDQARSYVQQQQHKSRGGVSSSSGSRHSLEDTVLRLQARNADKTNALSVYTRALEKVQKQSENIKVTTIKTTPIPTNSNAVFVDITTKSKQRDGSEPVDGMKESSMYSSKEENIGRKSGDTQKQSRRKGLPSSKGDRGDTMQRTSKSVEDRKLSRKKDEPKICRREEKQRLNRRREVRLQDDGKLSDKNEQSSDNEVTIGEKRDWDQNEHIMSVRNRVIHGIPKDLVRIGKPRAVYPEPQQILMDQLREMQDKVKQKAVTQGRPEVLQLSDDDNDSATDESSGFGILSPVVCDDPSKLSSTSRKSQNQKGGVYKCRMCTYEASDKADCIRHILKKHRYAMKHKSTLTIRSMAVYQSPSKKQSIIETSTLTENDSPPSRKSGLEKNGDGLHNIVRTNLQFALQKAEEVLKTRQSTNSAESVRVAKGQKEAEEIENHPLMCKKCNKVYATKSTLNLHIGIAHSDTRTYYPCTLCKKIFSGLQCVMRHMHVLHNMPMQKVYQMRDKLKKEAFTKPVFQSKTQLLNERRSALGEKFRKRMRKDSAGINAGPSKRRRLDSRKAEKGDFGKVGTISSDAEEKRPFSSHSSGVVCKDGNTKQETLAKQSASLVNGAKGEEDQRIAGPLKGPQISPSIKSTPERKSSLMQKGSRSEMGTRRSQSPRSMPRDLPVKSSPYVCRKCKHNFGRKISYENHIEMCRGGRHDKTPVRSGRKSVHVGSAKAASPSPTQGSNRKERNTETVSKDIKGDSDRETVSKEAKKDGDMGTSVEGVKRESNGETVSKDIKRDSDIETVRKQTKKDGVRETASKDQVSPKASLLVQNSIATRSKRRDSSSESQRSTSSEVQTSMRPRPRFSRSLSSDRNTRNRTTASPTVKLSAREKLLRRQIASSGNLNDGVRGRSRRSVFSMYAKFPRSPERLEHTRGNKVQVNRKERTQQKNESSLKKVAAVSVSALPNTQHDENSNSSSGMSAPTSKNVTSSIQFRQTRSGPKFESLATSNCKTGFDERHLPPDSLDSSLKESHDTKSRAACSFTEDNSSFNNTSTDVRGRGATLSDSPASRSGKSLSKETQEKGTVKSKEVSQGHIFDDLNEHTARANVASSSNLAVENKGLCDSSMDDEKSDVKPSQDTDYPVDTEEPASYQSQDDVQSHHVKDLSIEDKETIINEHCVSNITKGDFTKNTMTPNTHAIDQLMDAIKQTSVKKTTNRGRSLDNSGLKQLVVDTELAFKKEGISEGEENLKSSDNVGESSVSNIRQISLSTIEKNSKPTSNQTSKVIPVKSINSGAETLQQSTPDAGKSLNEGIFSTLSPELSQVSEQPPLPVAASPSDSSSAPSKVKGDKSFASSESIFLCKDEDDVSEKQNLCTGRSNKGTDSMASEKSHDVKTEEVKDQCSSVSEESDVEYLYSESTAAVQSIDTGVKADSSKSNSDTQKPISNIRYSTPSKLTSHGEESDLDQSESNFQSNASSNSRPDVQTRRSGGKQLTDGGLQGALQGKIESREEAKMGLRTRIAQRKVKESQRASSSRLVRSSDVRSKNTKPLSERKTKGLSKLQDVPKKSVHEDETVGSPESDVPREESTRDPSTGKTRKKRDKDAGRIKSTANRAYVMRSSAGEEKLECFDKAKIFRFVDQAKMRCLGCGMKYKEMYNLRRHIISNHLKWTRFRCSLCGKEHYDRSHCVRHVQKVHAKSLKERTLTYIKSLVVNLTKQGSQVRSKKITHSIKRNQETERQQSESIYARPTLSLRRRGRPTLALLSSSSSSSSSSPPLVASSLEKSPDDTLGESRKKGRRKKIKSVAIKEYSSSSSLGQAVSQFGPSSSQHEARQVCNDSSLIERDGDTDCVAQRVANSDVLSMSKNNSKHPHNIYSKSVMQGSNQCGEESHLFDQIQDNDVDSIADDPLGSGDESIDRSLILSVTPDSEGTLSKRLVAKTHSQRTLDDFICRQSLPVSNCKTNQKAAKCSFSASSSSSQGNNSSSSAAAAQQDKNHVGASSTSPTDPQVSTHQVDCDKHGDGPTSSRLAKQSSLKKDNEFHLMQPLVSLPSQSTSVKSSHQSSKEKLSSSSSSSKEKLSSSSSSSKNSAHTPREQGGHSHSCGSDRSQRDGSSSPEHSSIDGKLLDPPVVFIKSLSAKNLPQF